MKWNHVLKILYVLDYWFIKIGEQMRWLFHFVTNIIKKKIMDSKSTPKYFKSLSIDGLKHI